MSEEDRIAKLEAMEAMREKQLDVAGEFDPPTMETGSSLGVDDGAWIVCIHCEKKFSVQSAMVAHIKDAHVPINTVAEQPTFERWASIARLHCETIYKTRGREYGDTLKDPLYIFEMFLANISLDKPRLNQLAVLCDIKINRLRTGKFKLDTLDDLINYLLALRGGIKELTGE